MALPSGEGGDNDIKAIPSIRVTRHEMKPSTVLCFPDLAKKLLTELYFLLWEDIDSFYATGAPTIDIIRVTPASMVGKW